MLYIKYIYILSIIYYLYSPARDVPDFQGLQARRCWSSMTMVPMAWPQKQHAESKGKHEKTTVEKRENPSKTVRN